MKKLDQNRRCLAAAAVLVMTCFAASADAARPQVGDHVHGKGLIEKSGGVAKKDSAWLNRYSYKQAAKYMKTGAKGFPKITSGDVLDAYDATAYLQSINTDMRDMMDGSHVLVTKGKLDKYAQERLLERAKMKVGSQSGAVFVFYELGMKMPFGDVRLVRPKNNKKRDKLTPKKKVGYVFFQPVSYKGKTYEAAFGITKDIVIQSVLVRGPDGAVDKKITAAAQKLIGQGARGKYDRLKCKKDLAKPLSDAFLFGAETVYMYEVEERDYFTFFEED